MEAASGMGKAHTRGIGGAGSRFADDQGSPCFVFIVGLVGTLWLASRHPVCSRFIILNFVDQFKDQLAVDRIHLK